MSSSSKTFFATALIAIALSGNSYAQNMIVNTSGATAFTNESPASEGKIDKGVAVVTTIIATRFSSLFPGATMQQWSNRSDNFWVTFLDKDRKASACFTSSGKMNYVIKNCELEHLPESFRKTIRKKYSSYTLYKAIEIKAYDAVAYQVVLEDASQYITLKVVEGEVELIQQVKKSVD
ncbi:MAG: hypothetical protein WKF89_09605 [Chitinophagaceae bacterium]